MRPWICLVLTLTACGGIARERWEPRSASQPSNKIATTCLRIYAADVRPVAKAGGLPLGILDVTGQGEIMDESLTEAAEYGGTHCLVTGDQESTETTGVVVQAWGDGVIARPLKRDKRTLRILVIRVPLAGWPALSDPLTPTPAK
jgi:hypothetical protein